MHYNAGPGLCIHLDPGSSTLENIPCLYILSQIHSWYNCIGPGLAHQSLENWFSQQKPPGDTHWLQGMTQLLTALVRDREIQNILKICRGGIYHCSDICISTPEVGKGQSERIFVRQDQNYTTLSHLPSLFKDVISSVWDFLQLSTL